MSYRGWARPFDTGDVCGSRVSAPAPNHNEVTDVIAFDEFGEITDADADAGDTDARGTDETVVLPAPEFDDLDDTDNRPGGAAGRAGRRGQHRRPAVTPAKSRILIAAMAAGAASAAAHSAFSAPHAASVSAAVEPAANISAVPGDGSDAEAQGMQMVSVRPAVSTVVHDEELAKGMAFAQERAEREARLQQPLFVAPTRGIFTSGFGYRWGSLHGGVDVANSIGTPIFAVSDGVVIEAGPSAGYGQLVKLRHFDGTVTLYGHVDTTTVGVGERVMAGDQIATMGNRGDSTGPHLHLEVLVNGTSRINPVSWLASRGINVGA